MIADKRLEEIAIDIPDSMSLSEMKKLFDALVKHLTIGELVEMATELLSSRQTIKRLVEAGDELNEWVNSGYVCTDNAKHKWYALMVELKGEQK